MGKPPISRHPLFPATVALWFSALFGLGSLAIRPSLLESIVVSLQLDAVFSSMAPPLGATARILLALAMAVTGGVLGAWLARKIANPEQAAAKTPKTGSGRPKWDLARFGFGRNTEEAPQRRRQLTVSEEPQRRDFVDHVPVPGGEPLILDVAEMDLDGCDPEPHAAPADEPEIATDAKAMPDALSQLLADEAAAHDEIRPEPQPEAIEPAFPEDTRLQTDGPASPQQYPDFAQPEDAPNTLDAPAADTSSDNHDAQAAWPGIRKPVPFLEPESQPAPEPVSLPRFDLAQDSASQKGAIFNQKPETALFGEPRSTGQAPGNPPFTQNVSSESHDMTDTPPFAVPSGASEESDKLSEPLPDARIDAAQPNADEPTTQDTDDSDCENTPDPTAAERIATADPGELSHVELLARLSHSIEQRRQSAMARQSTDTGNIEPANTSPNETRVTQTTPAASDDSAAETGADSPLPSLSSESAPFPAPPAAIPAALRPVGLFEDDDDLPPLSVPPRHISQTRASQPSPVAESGFAENKSDNAQPEPGAEAQSPLARLSGVSPQPGTALSASGNDPESPTDEESVLEDGYSSLLNLSRPDAARQQFVRIEEPENDGDAIEPVVIFPGREPAGEGPFAKPAAPAQPSASPAQPEVHATPDMAADKTAPPPFAPPPEYSHGAPHGPTTQPQGTRDPEEEERALRSALASLQRMGGAA